MYGSLRDCIVMGDEFASPVEGMRHLGVDAVEIALSNDYKVCAMDAREEIALLSDEDATAYKKHLAGLGVRPTAFLTACDFSAGDLESSVRWVARAI